jgi:hypothetical protein
MIQIASRDRMMAEMMAEDSLRTSAPFKERGWPWRNRIALLAITVLLLGAAALGELGPAELSLTSAARPYNLFHLIAGLVGLGIFLSRNLRAAAAFNFGFGLIDLYQAVAGVLGWAPAQLFALRPADHVIHVLIGAALVAVAVSGARKA